MQSGANQSVVSFLNEIANQFPSAVFFASGAPASQFLQRLDLPVIQSALQSFARHGASGKKNTGSLAGLLQYGPTAGLINELIAEHLRVDDGLATKGERVIVTSGCQEALSLCLPVLCPAPTDTILVCNPTYIGATGAARSYNIGVECISIAAGDLADQIEACAEAERAKGRNVRALYLMPTFDNPSGLVLGRQERDAILAACARLRIVILEDNPYGMFDYDGSALPPLAEVDRTGSVIYLSTFSKTLAPSLRIGAATLPETLFGSHVARKELMARLVERKGLLTLNTSQLNQAIVGGMLLERNFSLRDWIAPAKALYRANRDALLAQLDSDFAAMRDLVRWTRPGGGFFISMMLPFPVDLDAVLHCAREQNVIVMPMRFFALDDCQNCGIRIAFSSVTPERAREGAHSLARYVRSKLDRAARAQRASAVNMMPVATDGSLAMLETPLHLAARERSHGSSSEILPRILGIGTMTTEVSYSQEELLERFGIEDRRIRSVFLNSGIKRRFLALPTRPEDGMFASETQGELLAKHRALGIEIGAKAIGNCLDQIGEQREEIAYLCCVTTTGFLSPGLSARICKELGLTPNCVRLDVVGMGCNAGLNALNAAAAWSRANPGKLGMVLCVEICSAGYVFDETMRTSVVNSLFGDGAAAIALRTGYAGAAGHTPVLLKFNSRIVLDAINAMRYDWDEVQGKFSFFLDPDIPYVIGANVESTISGLLVGTGLRRSDIAHWVVHSGGKKVIDAVKVNLGLSTHDLRHTSGVLRDYGNLSSGSFLFSYQRLHAEGAPAPGDYGIMMTMGPGSSIETALLQW